MRIGAMVTRRAFLATAGAGLIAGCSPFDLVNASVSEDGHDVETGLAYGPDTRHRLDLYRPKAAGGDMPVVLFFYGGSWRGGARGDYRFVGASLARAGILCAVADYRLYPQVRFPAFVEDGAAALALVGARARGWGGDPDRLFVAGHSAGAHIAALIATRRRWLDAHGLDPAGLAGLIGLAGPYAFDPASYRRTRPIFDGVAEDIDIRPAEDPETGPRRTLLLHGAGDTTVLPENSARMAQAMAARGFRAQARTYPDIGHALLVGSIAPAFSHLAPTRADIRDFVMA